MTRCYLKLSNGYIISTHILTRRMTKIKYLKQRSQVFQLTSSQGGWPPCIQCDTYQKYFNSHPHKEDDLSGCSLDSKQSNFNSHPHKEDDIHRKQRCARRNISTHILTRRMTCSFCASVPIFIISTHILTRRMTNHGINSELKLLFQLTSSQGGWLVLMLKGK